MIVMIHNLKCSWSCVCIATHLILSHHDGKEVMSARFMSWAQVLPMKLHPRCRNGSVEAIETVIAHGANVSAINNGDDICLIFEDSNMNGCKTGLMQWTPLHAAAYMGMVEVGAPL